MAALKKMKKIPSLREFNMILSNISHTDKIGHLFIADIKFHVKNLKTLLFNEKILEKSNLIKPYERSVLQILSVLSRNEEKDMINTFNHNAKTHLTINEKKYVSLYVEHMHFLVTRTGWLVTKICEHYTFEQTCFKKEFVKMSHKARQKAKTLVERDFYKLTNNANFGIDRQNNIGNCKFEPIYDEIGEISFIKKYLNIFGNEKYKDFPCIEIMRDEIEQTFDDEKLLALAPNDPTFEARKYSIKIERAENLDAFESMNEHKKIFKSGNVLISIKNPKIS